MSAFPRYDRALAQELQPLALVRHPGTCCRGSSGPSSGPSSGTRVRQGRFRRGSIEGYRGRAMNAWSAGADGIHLFNYFNPKAPLWRELGDPDTLGTLSKLYFVTVRDGNPSR